MLAGNEQDLFMMWGAIAIGVLFVVSALVFFQVSRQRYRRLAGRLDEERGSRSNPDSRESRVREQQLDAVLNTVVDGIIVIDHKGIVESFNPGAERIFGYRAHEVIGKNVNMLMPEPNRSQHDSYIANYLKTGEAKIIGHGREETGLRKNGKTFPMYLGIDVIPLKNNFMFTGIVRDETEKHERLHALHQANRELESFAYAVAHDLRGPLRSMDGFAQALTEDYSDKLDETGLDYLARISAAAHRMGLIIDGILTLSRLSRLDINIATVNLSEVAKSIIIELKKRDPDRDVDVHIASEIIARGDEDLLTILLENLVRNAWKFTADETRAAIEINTLVNENDEVIYFIRDNGVGFDMEYADKIFQPFERLHRETKFGGTGIGLATVDSIVKRHKGRIWVESEVGIGTTFYFSLWTQNNHM